MDKKRFSIIILVVGLITLICGVVFFIVRLTARPSIADGEFLVSVGKWKLQEEGCLQAKCDENEKCLGADGNPAVVCDGDSVVWNFTEIGKGTLTTNNHLNDYNFIWAIEDDKLKIETEWLYTLNNEYEYKLDQNDKTLILKNDNDEIRFIPAEQQ